MARRVEIILNSAGVREIARSTEARRLVDGVANRAAGLAGGSATVTSTTTDRAVARVSVPSWEQAARGSLTSAFSAMGIEVRAWRG